MSVHNAGPISTQTREEQLIAANDGEPIDHLLLLEDTHTNKRTGQIQDPVVAEIIATVKAQKELRTSQQSEEGSSASLSVEEINQMVLEAAPSSKGRVLGLGNKYSGKSTSASSHYEAPPGIVEELAATRLRVTELEKVVEETRKQREEEMEEARREREEAKKEREENRRFMEQMKERFRDM